MSVCDGVQARGWLWAWGDTNSFRCSTQQHSLHNKLVAQERSLGANSLPGLIYQIPVGSLSYIKSYSVGEALRHHHIHNHFSFVSAPPSWNSLFQWNSASNRSEGLAHISKFSAAELQPQHSSSFISRCILIKLSRLALPSPCSRGRHWTLDPPASVSQIIDILGLR